MSGTVNMPRDYIFVSYSHQDAEWLDRLRIFLKPFSWGLSHKEGGRLWVDPYIQTGERWRREIGDGLARARIAVLLVSQDFLASGFIGKQELPQIEEGAAAGEVTIVCIPVSSSNVHRTRKALLEYQWPRPQDQPLDLLPRAEQEAALAVLSCQLDDVATAVGLNEAAAVPTPRVSRPGDEARPAAVEPLPGAAPGKLFGVPAQRPHHISRLDVRDRIRNALLSGTREAVGITGAGAEGASGRVGLFGQGGLGKTVAAVDLVHDGSVRLAFPDGIHWLTLGQSPDLAGLQSALLQQLTGARAVVESVASGTGRIRELLAERACLLVLDDVWHIEHARAFDVAGARCRTLTTTRDAGVLTAIGAENVELDLLSEPEALALLATWIGRPAADLPKEARMLVGRCGYLPLAISVAGAMVHDGTAWADLLAELEAGNLRFLDHPYASVFTSLRLSVDALEKSVRARYLELAVAPEDVPLPVAVVVRLWAHTGGTQDYECRKLLAELERKALLYREGEGETASVRFHDLQRDFLQLAADDVRALHAKLLDAYARTLAPASAETHRAWWTLPADEPYLWRHLSDHLAKADRRGELRGVLLDYRWIAAKLRATDVNALLRDFDASAGDRSAGLVQEALRISAHVLATDRAQLAGQLTGRLLRVDVREIRALLWQARKTTTAPWLQPLRPSLIPPGGALVRTLVGHTAEVNCIAVMPDGKRVISASRDKTLKIWELETGTVLHTLEGHRGAVTCVALTLDGKRAVSASWDLRFDLGWYNTFIIWDLATGVALHTLRVPHADQVTDIAVTPDCQRAVSVSSGGILVLWDLATGAMLHNLEGHKGPVTKVVLTPDGKRAVSASDDYTLKIWDLAMGATLHTLESHQGKVTNVALTVDGKRAVSISNDFTCKVWDLATGTLLQTFDGDMRTSIAVSSDGRRAISASLTEIDVWDLATGALLQTIPGHSPHVTCVAFALEGEHAISDGGETLKLWNLVGNTPHNPLEKVENHPMPVLAVAVTSDNKHAVSASWEGMIKVWDLATSSVLRIFQGGIEVHAITVTANGECTISSSGRDLIIRDLATGAVLNILRGHTDNVHGVAATQDQKWLVSASADTTLRVWDLGSGAMLHTLEGHANSVTGVAVTPDGQRAVSASRDRTLKIWDLATGLVLGTFQGHTDAVLGVALTFDCKRAVSASSDKTLKIWDIATGAVLKTLWGHTRSVTSVAVTWDGRWAVSASKDRTLKVWDLASGVLVATYTADGLPHACAVASDGVTIVAGDALGRVHFLRLENA